MTHRLPLDPPKQRGLSDEALATSPLSYRDDALQGKVVPQSVKLPLATAEDPNFKDGVNYYSKEGDNFFVGNSFPTCGINFTAQEIMGQSEGND